jgi:hypothetical protein
MRKPIFLNAAFLATAFVSHAGAQTTRPSTPAKDYSQSPIVKHMMAFDKNNDGKLARDEITDPRLLRLFDEADVNKSGVVTPEELAAVAAKRDAEMPAGGNRRGGGPGGPGGRQGRGPNNGAGAGVGGPGGASPGADAQRPDSSPGADDQGPPGRPGGSQGPGGPDGHRPGPPPTPGTVLPSFVQDDLNLTADQKSQVADLQKDVTAKLAKILTPEQIKQMQSMHPPGGPGGPDDGPPPGNEPR